MTTQPKTPLTDALELGNGLTKLTPGSDRIVAEVRGKTKEPKCPPYSWPEFWQADGAYFVYEDGPGVGHQDVGLKPGEWLLTASRIRAAFDNPKLPGAIVGRLLGEQDDAIDADALIQVAMFGEIVYG